MSVTTALPSRKRIPPTAGRTANASGRLCQVLVSSTMPSTVVYEEAAEEVEEARLRRSLRPVDGDDNAGGGGFEAEVLRSRSGIVTVLFW